MEYEIGIGKTGRRAYGLDEVAIVPSRRTRDPDDVDISWEIDAYTFPLPMMASAMDAGVSPATAIEVGRLGGLACLNLEGLQTRYDDPEPIFDEIAALPDEKATRRMQELYKEPVKPELIVKRIREIKDAGHVTSASHHAATGDRVRPARARGRARHPGDPGDGRLRGARLHADRAAQPQGVHRVVRPAGDRGRVRVVLDGAPPDADRRGRACWSASGPATRARRAG